MVGGRESIELYKMVEYREKSSEEHRSKWGMAGHAGTRSGERKRRWSEGRVGAQT